MDKPTEPTPLRILLLEDISSDAELMEHALREAGLPFIAKRVDTREAFTRALDEFKPDIVLADYKLPSFDGGTALKIVRQQHPEIPLVMVTGAMGDEKAIELLKQGAKNYVLKDRLARLGPAVQMALEEEKSIRARKAAEQALRQSEADFRALVEHSPIAMLVDIGVGAGEKIVMMNRKFTELFGYTLEDVPDAQHWWPLAYPDDAYREEIKAEWTRRAENAFQTRGSIEPMEASVTCKDESIRYVRGSFTSIGSKNILGFEDLTKRKQAEDELERFFNLIPDLVCIASADGHFLKINPAWQESLGYTTQEILAKPFLDLIHPDDRAATMKEVERQLAGEATMRFSNRYRCKDGSYKWLEWKATPAVGGKLLFASARDITEHRQAEARLAESEERYRLVQENSMDAILLTAPDGSIFSANKAACKMFQRTEEEICKLGRNALVDTSDPRLTALIEERARTGKASGKLTMLRKDGSRFPVEISSSIFTDSHGNKRSSMIIRDITERNSAEARLAESERHFRAVAESANDAIVTISGSGGGIVDWNPAAERLFGRSKAEMTALPLTALMPERFRDLHRAGIARVMSGGAPHVIGKAVEVAGLRKDGSEFPLELSLARWHVGQSQFFTAIIRDITGRKQAERILWESEERYRSLFENMLEGYAHCKMLFEQGEPQDFIYIGINRAFEKLTGLKNVVGRKVSEVIPGIHASNPELLKIYGRVVLTGQPEKFDTYLDTLKIWLSITVYRPEKEHFIAIFDNVTERKHFESQQALEYRHIAEINLQLTEANKQLKLAQSQLLQSAKMASVGLLAAGVAHEINNPIGYVNSNMGTLEKYLADIFTVIDKFEDAEMVMGMLMDANDPLLEELRRFKEKINLDYIRKDIKALIAESHQGLERVKRIVLDLKNFSHADSDNQWLWSDIHQVLDTTLNVVWNELKYKCEVVKEYGELPKIYCLPSQLDQVFMNLLVNAAHAIEVRGKITLRTGQEGDLVWVEVSDTGKGIPPENIPNLFDPFFTTKPVGQGTGLGLSVSYSIVAKHHGKIEVHSEVGKGSTFRVWLPVLQPDIKEKP